MITVSYNAYFAISKEGDNDIWTVRPREVVPLLPLCSQTDVGATVNALLGETFSRENNTHGSQFHDRDPQFASRILGAMTQSCYIGTRDIRSRVIRGPYCTLLSFWPSGVNVSEISIKTQNFSFKKMHLKILSEKWWPFCSGLNVLISAWDCSRFVWNHWTNKLYS